MVYDKDVTEDKLKARFEAITGADYNAFFAMSSYHNIFDENSEYDEYNKRFIGKPLFWQDITEGLYDFYLYEKPMSAHYAKHAQMMKGHEGDAWDYVYDFAYKVFDYLATKCEIAEKLRPAYLNGDKEMLRKISDELLPLLKIKTDAVHMAHRDVWYSNLKSFGWSNLDVRYAGVNARIDSAKLQIDAYLEGKLSAIDSLEEERLPIPLTPFRHYSAISTPNIKT
jgi:hypothetical protein